MTTGRSSFAIAIKDYTFVRPGVAVSISAATLVASLVIGVALLQSLRSTTAIINRGLQTAATVRGYTAALEVWREMAARGDPRLQRPEAEDMRDSIRAMLTVQFRELRAELTDSTQRALVEWVIESLRQREVGLTTEARRAVIALLAKQDGELRAATESMQSAVRYVTILLGLMIVVAGMLIIPMAWLYIRYKRGAMIEVKV